MRRAPAIVSAALLFAASLAPAQQQAETGSGALLRALDKVNGEVRDIEMPNATSSRFGRLTINLGECRYPAGNPAGDAYAFLTIQEDDRPEPYFSGWMIASAPALNALDHPRYDVWVMRCNTDA
ncbi:DUF2155 domain-containing protein [Roseovarius sp. SCSIO 43702]|uniref:DUF2155 domain-containing protein n=1 Tax=Roseovarius sp. SCSIO 43702 TaxID=2823043 RepID=UPI001C7365C4|nr:DUF2155 domain-containing protein [Roseovarius sp. SCSIO 43702]QYX56060.1 DUF2155 domain-containing protein [Roseovarius sp. SCSIO 43702]